MTSHRVVRFEIGCQNRGRTTAFYRTVFGWNSEPSGPWSDRIVTGAGLPGHVTALGHDPHNYVMLYVEVVSIAETARQVESLGGTVVIPRHELPDGGWFAWLSDPEGTMFGLIEPA
jgi:uncharacterized protein